MHRNSNIEKLPFVAVGGVLFHENRVLLVKRGKSPAKGLWAIPGGKINPGEQMKDALKREFMEETGIEIKVGDVVYVFDAIDIPDFHYVIIDFAVEIISGKPRAGDDAEEVKWFKKEELREFPVAPATIKLLRKYKKFDHAGNNDGCPNC